MRRLHPLSDNNAVCAELEHRLVVAPITIPPQCRLIVPGKILPHCIRFMASHAIQPVEAAGIDASLLFQARAY